MIVRAIVLMGVSGCGKTRVGQALSDALGWPFYDGDDFHSAENVEKMSKGLPLNDQDRAPWLLSLRDLVAKQAQLGKNLILACSALKKNYRDQLREGTEGLVFVHLVGDFELIWSRMQNRADHYMKADMLESQFRALETPTNALVVGIEQPISAIVKNILTAFGLE